MTPFELSAGDRKTVPAVTVLFAGLLLAFGLNDRPIPEIDGNDGIVEAFLGGDAADDEFFVSGRTPIETLPGGVKPWSFRVELNRAERSELLILPGVGPALADRIIQYRQTEGPFRQPEEIEKIRGIGKIKTAKLLPFLTVE